LLATVHDEAAVNGSAIASIKDSGDLPYSLDSICASHTINNACLLFKAKYLDEMDRLWNQYVSHSPATWHAYKLFVGHPCPRLTNQIRWFVKWEMWRDLFVYFQKTGDYLSDEGQKKGVSSNVLKLSQLFTKPSQTLPSGSLNPNYASQCVNYRSLYFELAVVVAYGRPMCKATYFFERSKDMVVPFAQEKIKGILDLLTASDLPQKVMDVIATFEPAFQSVKQWKDKRDEILAPVLAFMKKKFVFDTKPVPTKSKPKTKALRRYGVTRLFAFAELLRPDRFREWYAGLTTKSKEEQHKDTNVFACALRQLLADLPFVKTELVNGLISQLVEMNLVAQGSKTLYKASNLWESFWQPLEKKASISWWYHVAARVSIIPVSTADVERVVSVFTDVVGDDQANMIEETIETTVITRYNNRTPKKRKHRRFCDDDEVESDGEGED
jgi:hypothetical protein